MPDKEPTNILEMLTFVKGVFGNMNDIRANLDGIAHVCGEAAAEMKKLQAENKKLKAQLRKVRKHIQRGSIC